MSHPAPFPALGVAAGILLAGGTPVTWVWLPKKGCSESGHAGCSWLWAITHVAVLTDRRSSHFQQGPAMDGRGQGGGEELSPTSPAVAGRDRDNV